MIIPTLIYVEFYLILKKKFIEKIPAFKRSQVEHTRYNFWKAKAEDGVQKLFGLVFGPETTNPKFFYNKYQDALNYPTIPIEEKDGLIIHIVENIFGLTLPEEIEGPGDLFFDERAQVLFQVLFEEKSPTFYKDNLVHLKVFDRETKKIDFKKIRTDNRVVEPDVLPPGISSEEKTAQIPDLDNVPMAKSDETEFNETFYKGLLNQVSEKDVLFLLAKLKLKKQIEKYFVALSMKRYDVAYRYWHPISRADIWGNSLSNFRSKFYNVKDIKLISSTDLINENEYSFHVYYDVEMSSHVTLKLWSIIQEPKLLDFRDISKYLKSVLEYFREHKIDVDNKSIKSLFDYSLVDELQEFGADNITKFSSIFPIKLIVKLRRFAMVSFAWSEEEKTYQITKFENMFTHNLWIDADKGFFFHKVMDA
ncbi:hypothetical protein KXD93_25480 [Mucilaginibacter sp. BJC16-A38]|uniref:hypothetical protein n=1 Tax=Mucilaginibacter phenanthrenivorans TaxID=1234842 RepID=UPI002157F72C|nr:hypothetical protein [Mucilaginibacter phenanthrenivorans]MCR8561034.1 hypothetical protein [Mucilaginibacter phenanthrenivorans]